MYTSTEPSDDGAAVGCGHGSDDGRTVGRKGDHRESCRAIGVVVVMPVWYVVFSLIISKLIYASIPEDHPLTCTSRMSLQLFNKNRKENGSLLYRKSFQKRFVR